MAMVALPIVIVTSYVLFQRCECLGVKSLSYTNTRTIVALGQEQKRLPGTTEPKLLPVAKVE